MKTLLRTYLVLIFASSALNAGSENDSIKSGFLIEASNFATNTGYSQNLEGIADCMNSSTQKENKTIKRAVEKNVSEERAYEEINK
ncbi:hypothetical protein SYJ56_20360 [Algoriphagus sp. D3-2-R+10]|uniref:hypothetical protein n=1 Tax=Algoriphagus aurantiacus TaxID=3103948 RepID=UPI002B3B79E1|nr:hypothetical protein [Algoriphagus sp. D3-2-R+10]MEB2777680.1 hypothetical protein [Algoriphagus sp. D3-2-R+10]